MMRKVQVKENGDGSTSYRVRFRLKGVEKVETFRAPDAAEEFAGVLNALGPRGALAWLDAQQVDDSSTTLDEMAERHIDALSGITDGTRGEYRLMYDREGSKSLGSLPLTRMDPDAAARAVNELSSRRSDKTVRNYHGLLFAILDTAVEVGEIPKNPCKGIRLPRRTEHETEEHRYLSTEEFATLYACVRERDRPLVAFLVGTGCRFGEAAALIVRDVNLKKRTVLIRQGVKWARGEDEKIVGPTKTKRSRRTVTLPRQVVEVLAALVKGRAGDELVFTAPRGGRVHQGSFWTRAWEPALDKAELDDPQPRIHDLRHTHASWLIGAGRPLPYVQRRLGHESIQTTVDTYGHLAPDKIQADADAAEIIQGDLTAAAPDAPAIES